MANTKSASKRARQTVARTARNRAVASNVRTHLKQVRSAAAEGNKETATTHYATASSVLDRAAKAGRVHRNTANRKKSRLAQAIAKIG